MNEKLKKLWNDHKATILLAGGTILTVTLCAIGVKKKLGSRKSIDAISDLVENVDIPTNFNVGKITDLWNEGEYLNAIVNNVAIDDLGRLGKEFVNCGIVPDDSNVSLIIGFN